MSPVHTRRSRRITASAAIKGREGGAVFVLFNCRNITVPVYAVCQYQCSIAAKMTVIICASVLYYLLSVHISARSKYFAIVAFYKS